MNIKSQNLMLTKELAPLFNHHTGRPFMNRQEIMQAIRKHNSFFLAHGVKQLGIFGSYARDEAREDSDIDLIVEFAQGMKSYDNFIEISFFLEDLFGRKIELVTLESISPFFKPHIDKDVYYETIH